MPKKNFIWIREDFRLQDNPALYELSNNSLSIQAFYIYNENKFKNRSAQRWWLGTTLLNFQKKINKIGISLKLYLGEEYEIFKNFIIKEKIELITWNKIFNSNEQLLERKIEGLLNKNHINFKNFNGSLLQDPFSIRKNDNTPFQVFTPYWRNAEERYLKKNIYRKKIIKFKNKSLHDNNEKALNKILPKKKWYIKFQNIWNPGEDSAKISLKNFIEKKIENYDKSRDIPSIEGTSKLSPHLSFGEISPQTIFEYCYKIKNKNIGFRKYINEIGWREFAHHLLNFFPQMENNNLRKQFDKFKWIKDPIKLKKWKLGLTGYPIVDAGMRELYDTGWMHNRVRMITASFLVKHLRINWMEGEKHFRNCLLDFNKANNISGWQWVAGCGADAAPYFRIFNPILQGEKFDPEGIYVKRWVIELKNVPKKFIHKPWEMSEEEQSSANFSLKKDYLAPIVDHTEARNSALQAFQDLKK